MLSSNLKAYDSVWRPALYLKLENLGFGGKTLELIKSMYRNDSLRFLLNGHYSEELWLSKGVKQGQYRLQQNLSKLIDKF